MQLFFIFEPFVRAQPVFRFENTGQQRFHLEFVSQYQIGQDVRVARHTVFAAQLGIERNFLLVRALERQVALRPPKVEVV